VSRRASGWIYGVVAAACASALYLASKLEPAATGIGTHEQLGLPPCFFHRLTGVPCPSCGVTTAFAWAMRGDFAAAFLAQPFGLVLFFLAWAAIPLSLALYRRGVELPALVYSRAATRWLWGLSAMYAAGWAFKIAVR
jgi:hypothetical protein